MMDRILCPFRYLAGWKALLPGLLVIILCAIGLSLGGMYQDALCHFTYSDGMPFYKVLLLEVMWWLLPSMMLWAASIPLTRSRARIIDVLGTEAFAQLPLLPMIAVMMIPRFQSSVDDLLESLTSPKGPDMDALSFMLVAAVLILLLLLVLIWWTYQAFSVSTNLKGGKAVAVFASVLLIARILGGFLVDYLI